MFISIRLVVEVSHSGSLQPYWLWLIHILVLNLLSKLDVASIRSQVPAEEIILCNCSVQWISALLRRLLVQGDTVHSITDPANAKPNTCLFFNFSIAPESLRNCLSVWADGCIKLQGKFLPISVQRDSVQRLNRRVHHWLRPNRRLCQLFERYALIVSP